MYTAHPNETSLYLPIHELHSENLQFDLDDKFPVLIEAVLRFAYTRLVFI